MKVSNSSLTLLDSALFSLCPSQERKGLLEQAREVMDLCHHLACKQTYKEKVNFLNALPQVRLEFTTFSPLKSFVKDLSLKQEYLIKVVFALYQGPHLFEVPKTISHPQGFFENILNELEEIERFYEDIGGIVGYQNLVLSHLSNLDEKKKRQTLFYPPEGVDLSSSNEPLVRRAIIEGIFKQKEIAEFYPVGGAADRLDLKDEKTGKNLPAACLLFQGKHLLEGVIYDLEAREYLHYKLFHQQIVTPVVLMTSKVHQNHDQIQKICIKNHWFGRGKKNFKFLIQPSVPVFNREGKWCLKKPLELFLRPSGHGALWLLANKQGIFRWLKLLGKKKILVRQINNPIGGIDYGLTAFLGIGHLQKKLFGFASCKRRVHAHEGVNVLKVSREKTKQKVSLTCIEYCDFEKFGIEDKPQDSNKKYSYFPSNTNILFADLEAIEKAARKILFPGLLINFRKSSHFDHVYGEKNEEIARLETTMQNISEAFSTPFYKHKSFSLATYLTFNKRHKTISTTKKKASQNKELLETVEGCFYDFTQNVQELLSDYCHMKIKKVESETAFLQKGPPFLMSYHPCLGPFYSLIGQKIRLGEIKNRSELKLEIADLDMQNLFLEGSLLIVAKSIHGHHHLGKRIYSHKTGQCILKNVCVRNKGIDWQIKEPFFWKRAIKREESVTIELLGHSRFEARNVTFQGPHFIKVPDKVHLIVSQEKGKLIYEKRLLKDEGPFWDYHIQENQSIRLKPGKR